MHDPRSREIRRAVTKARILTHAANTIPVESTTKSAATIIGVGSVGSFCALALSKLGLTLSVIDPDYVELKNVANQLYGMEAAAKRMQKVMALQYSLAAVGLPAIDKVHAVGVTTDTLSNAARWDTETDTRIIVVAVDSMNIRTHIYNCMHYAARYMAKPYLYIDFRMGVNAISFYTYVNTIRGARTEYANTLYDDAAAQDIPCDQQASIVTPMMAGALCAREVTQFLRWCEDPTNNPPPRKQLHLTMAGDHNVLQVQRW